MYNCIMKISIDNQNIGKRIDAFISEVLSDKSISRSILQKYIQYGCKVNGVVCKKSYRLRKNDVVEIDEKYWKKVKNELELPIVTDIHLPEEAAVAAEVVDIVQIPAFLCRQTDLLVAAAQTKKIVNIKKGQFLAPGAMEFAAKKVSDAGNRQIMLTERGSTFGYHDLIVDMRSIPIMQQTGYPVVVDVTHSL